MDILAFFLKHRIQKKDIIVIGFVFLAFFLFVIFNSKRLQKEKAILDKSFRYTVCVTTGKVKNIRSSGPDLNYEFNVNFITYGGSQRFIDDGKIDYSGGRYYVKFNPENPAINKILLQYPVPSNVIEIPDSGWIQIPLQLLRK